MSYRSSSCCAALCSCLVLAPTIARTACAQEAPPPTDPHSAATPNAPADGDSRPGAPSNAETYDEAIARAMRETQYGNWEEALAALRKAHAMRPSPRTLRGVGIALFWLRRYVECIDVLDRALAPREGPDALDGELRESAEDARRQALEYVATVRVELTPPDATLLVDGSPREERLQRLDRGRHEFTAVVGDHRETVTLELEMGSQRTVTLDPLAHGAPDDASDKAPAAAPADPPQVADEGTDLSGAAAASFIVGGTGLATFGVFGVLSLIEHSKLDDRCAPDCTDSQTATLDTYNLVADLGLGIGLAGVAVGVVLLLVSDGSHAPADANGSVSMNPSVVPWVGASGPGLLMRGRW